MRSPFAASVLLLVCGCIAHADDKGTLSLTAKIPTVEGARNAAVDGAGNAYLSHAKASEILVVLPSKK